MARVLLYYAHPGHRHSQANRVMFRAARRIDGISALDLYARYPRHDIQIDAEQTLLRDHDIIVLQYPIFWYSSPSLVKEWLDLVLERGFAYGDGGNALQGKTLLLAVTAAGPEDAYSDTGYQGFPLRTFLTPMQQTARLCQMRFAPPYVLFSALEASATGEVDRHVTGYVRLLEALRDDRLDFQTAANHDVLTHATLPLKPEA